jgi:hypothetical protein
MQAELRMMQADPDLVRDRQQRRTDRVDALRHSQWFGTP